MPSIVASATSQHPGADRGGRLDGQLARQPRGTHGRVRSAEWMAKRIVVALTLRRQRLYGDWSSYLASLLYRLAPQLYLRLMRKRFAAEFAGK